MTDRTISLSQLLTVLFLALFPLGSEWLVELLAPAGAAAWLCPLAAGAVLIPLARLVSRRGMRDPLDGFGPRAARVWAGAFLVWGLLLTTAQAVRVGSRLAGSLRATPVLLTAAVLLLAGWMVAGGLPAFARACEIFALAVGGGFLFLCLFGVFRLEWKQVLLWEPGALAQTPAGALTSAGVLAVGCFALFMIGEVRAETSPGRQVLLRLGGLSLLLSAVLVLVLGRFGAALAGRLQRPFFQMVSGLGFEGAFQRLEELVSALWVLGDVALLGFLLLAMERLVVRVRGKAGGHETWWLTALVFLLSLPTAAWTHLLAETGLLWGSLVAGVAMTLLSARSAKRRKL
mgnify:CR=1 FL=1